MSRLLLLAFLLAPGLARAQAWTLEPGRAYAKVTAGFADADERFDAAGDLVPFDSTVTGTPYRDRSFYLYGELGLARQLTLFGLLPYKRVTVRQLDLRAGAAEEFVDREGEDLGTAVVGLRVGLEEALGLDERSALAANASVALPLGYRRNVAPAVGAGQVDAQLLLSYGRSFWPLPLYAQAGAGYRYRTGIYEFSRVVACSGAEPEAGEPVCVNEGGGEVAYSDEWLLRFEAGYTVFDRVLVQGLAHVVWSVDEPEAPATPAGVLQPEAFPQQRYVRTGLGLTFYVFGETGLSVQAFTAPYARNALSATEFFVGVETRL